MESAIEVSTPYNITSKQTPVDTIDANDGIQTQQIKENLQKYEQLFGADEDVFEQPTTTRKELWSYYLYHNVSQHDSTLVSNTHTS